MSKRKLDKQLGFKIFKYKVFQTYLEKKIKLSFKKNSVYGLPTKSVGETYAETTVTDFYNDCAHYRRLKVSSTIRTNTDQQLAEQKEELQELIREEVAYLFLLHERLKNLEVKEHETKKKK